MNVTVDGALSGVKVSDIEVERGQRNMVSLKSKKDFTVKIHGTTAELFTMCKKIIDTIYKDQPMQKAVAKANLIEE